MTQKGKEVNKDKVNLKGIISESGIFNFYKEKKANEVTPQSFSRLLLVR